MEEEEADYLVKFIVIGDSGTGKSCLLRQFLDGRFPRSSTHTIGVEFGCKKLPLGNQTLKLQIWDTAGQERFRSVTRSYYRGSAAALIVYDVTRRDTFSHVKDWLADARNLANQTISVAVVGNKTDLAGERVITKEEADIFCKENGVVGEEVSALTGLNVEKVFTQLTQLVTQHISSGQMSQTFLRTPLPPSQTEKIDSSCGC